MKKRIMAQMFVLFTFSALICSSHSNELGPLRCSTCNNNVEFCKENSIITKCTFRSPYPFPEANLKSVLVKTYSGYEHVCLEAVYENFNHNQSLKMCRFIIEAENFCQIYQEKNIECSIRKSPIPVNVIDESDEEDEFYDDLFSSSNTIQTCIIFSTIAAISLLCT